MFAALWGVLNDTWNSVSPIKVQGSGVIYTVHVLAFWSGMWLLIRSSHLFGQSFINKPCWRLILVLAGMIFLGLFELIPMLRFVMKDTAMLAALVLTVGIICNFPRNKTLKVVALLCCLALLFYGMGVRHNAIFAVIPLLVLLLITATGKQHLLIVVPASLLLWGVMLAGIWGVNYQVLEAKRQHSFQEIIYNDIWRLNFKTKTFELPPTVAGEGWEPLDQEVFFKFFNIESWYLQKGFMYINRYYPEPIKTLRDFSTTPEDYTALQEAWLAKIKKHPSTYIQIHKDAFLDLMRAFSFMGLNGLIYLIFSTVIGCIFLAKTFCWHKPKDLTPYMIVTSDLLYVLPYFLVVPDIQRRYLFWFYWASFFGVVWFAHSFWKNTTQQKKLS